MDIGQTPIISNKLIWYMMVSLMILSRVYINVYGTKIGENRKRQWRNELRFVGDTFGQVSLSCHNIYK